MSTPLLFALVSIRSWFRTRARLQLENLALRHQLIVLKRPQRGRPRLDSAARWRWVWLARFWSNWRSALLLVKPQTEIACECKGFRWYWRWKSRQSEPVSLFLNSLLPDFCCNPGGPKPRKALNAVIYGHWDRRAITSPSGTAGRLVNHVVSNR